MLRIIFYCKICGPNYQLIARIRRANELGQKL
jgi:hypothetical protein